MELDVFPDNLKTQACELGQVLKMKMFPEDGITPKRGIFKEKRFVVIGKSDETLSLAALIVNSDINDNLFMRIGPYQHKIFVQEYDFLDHDSYIDGYTLHEFSIERVIQEATYLGRISDNDLQESIDRLLESKNIKKYLQERYNLSHSKI